MLEMLFEKISAIKDKNTKAAFITLANILVRDLQPESALYEPNISGDFDENTRELLVSYLLPPEQNPEPKEPDAHLDEDLESYPE